MINLRFTYLHEAKNQYTFFIFPPVRKSTFKKSISVIKSHWIIAVLFFISQNSFAQILQSPESFLGYKIGSRFTPHYKIVEYVKSVAQARPDMVKIENYGATTEGRELLLAYVSASQNIQQLDKIRNNNLRLSGMLHDQSKGAIASTNNPAIVWLSYNVHGNEASSSEAAMLTLFSLVNPSNSKPKEWLQNTVVIIDPCLNPDGRDRYVNWFNSVRGGTANVDPQSREHNEPWPGGRSNHYNFDLNRDWAWQTQLETRQRMIMYNKWMPQVHVDFHEQGYNSPYYFAPAAEPFHEVITPWQREFQKIIGKNNAKYFDENGWLYFTKESFDLFYPSYGDTYPLYNGAIGMTYEQGGSSRGGLAVVTNTTDTLTLEDRVMHHYTTGLATIETSSQNAQKLLNGFKQFFDDSRAGRGNGSKAYILTSDNAASISSMASLLSLNKIEYGTISIGSQSLKGLDYSTGKESKIVLKTYSIAVNNNQPKSVLARVLLEPKSMLADSVTYDITAWSLPYVYNVDAYAVKEEVSVTAYENPFVQKMVPLSSYGYLVKYNSINSVKLLTQLLKQHVKVRYSEKPFIYNEQQYERGTLIILQKGNPANLPGILNELSAKNDVEIQAVTTGFMDKGPDFGSADIRFLKPPKIALVTGEQASSLGAGEVWHLFDQQLDYPISLINANDFIKANLGNYDVFIIPDGFYKFFDDKAGTDKLKDFVKNGGTLIVMEGAARQLAVNTDWGFKLKENKDKEEKKDSADYSLLKRYESRERDNLINNIPGAIYKIQLDNSHPLAFGYSNTYYTLKQDPAVYEFIKDGWNIGIVKTDNYVTGFAGKKVKAQLKDGVIFGTVNLGNGTIVLMADDPLFRQFWEAGKLLFCNAVFLVGN